MTLCLKVKKKLAEETRKLLIEESLLSKKFKITSEGEYLLIPLNKDLDEVTKGKLSALYPDFQIITIDKLKPLKDKPNNHFEYLEDKLSPEEFNLVPRSFDTIGDIIVIEIPDELLTKKELIGKALLEVHSSIRSVFVKTGIVSGVNRIRPVELIAGENKTKTIYREHGIRLAVDITQAYFSPRLSDEHSRIANQVINNEIIVDMFAGIGPFAIPIAKRVNATIHAIDINPRAIDLLIENITLNKLQGKIHPYCGDSRIVVKKEALENIADRVIMNLPGYAIEFIDVACKLIKPTGGIIHFFEFVGGEREPEDIIIEDIAREAQKNNRKIENILAVRRVRMSAPRQWQMVVDAKIK
ncbi:MAG: class I SAM-dependent methyltransferase family protein [Candidatus Heimdallarchaeota archaeon]|nr:class I SAM-dependent methyltransferase family protein [Candidatus Heimdallarchaeota archaeon]